MRNPTIHDCRVGDRILDHGDGQCATVITATHDKVEARYDSGSIVSWYATSLRMGTDIELLTDDDGDEDLCDGCGEEPVNCECLRTDDDVDTQPMAVAAKVAVLRADGVRR